MTEFIVLGLDGATWDVLDPLENAGYLPNLSNLCSLGHSGTLESTYPPITAPAWLSMATGQNPGKTGVFYFLNREDPESFDFESLDSGKFNGRSFWDVLTARGHSVGVFNFPMLYPPYDLGDGFMVSGLGSPEDETITKPDGLRDELDQATGGYQIKVPYADPKYADNPNQLHDDLLTVVDKRERAIEYLLTEKDPDVFFGVVSATDWVQHYFWRHYDENHVLHDTVNADHEYVETLWERVDKTIGLVSDIAEKDEANLLLVSDHGFGPVNRTFHSNQWLREQGFQFPEQGSPLDWLRTEYFPYLRRAAKPVVSLIPQLNALATSVGRSVRGDLSSIIDMEQSVVFAPEQNLTCGMLYLLSDDSADEDAVVNALASLSDETEPVDVDIHSPDELYAGENVELAPDILFTVQDFECAVDPRPGQGNVFSEGPPSAARSGGHRREGIYLLSGPDVEAGAGPEYSILDIAPTLLAMMGEPIPEAMDGDPIHDAFSQDRRDSLAVERRPLEELVDSPAEDVERDADRVQERLEDLGYI